MGLADGDLEFKCSVCYGKKEGQPTLLNLEAQVTYLNLSLITIEVTWSMPFLSSLMDFKAISVDSLTEKAVHNRSRMTFSETSDCFCADLMSTEELGWECRVSSCCDF